MDLTKDNCHEHRVAQLVHAKGFPSRKILSKRMLHALAWIARGRRMPLINVCISWTERNGSGFAYFRTPQFCHLFRLLQQLLRQLTSTSAIEIERDLTGWEIHRIYAFVICNFSSNQTIIMRSAAKHQLEWNITFHGVRIVCNVFGLSNRNNIEHYIQFVVNKNQFKNENLINGSE